MKVKKAVSGGGPVPVCLSAASEYPPELARLREKHKVYETRIDFVHYHEAQWT